MSTTYPIFLNLRQHACLVVGAGAVGRRKIEGLRAAGAEEILVIDPAIDPADPFFAQPEITLATRPFVEADVHGKTLVFAATDDFAVNKAVAKACSAAGVLCNVATSRELSDFLIPSSFSLEGLHVAVFTDGASPALSRRLRLELEDYLARNFSGLAALMGRLRPLVLALGRPSAENAEIFRSVVDSGIAVALREHNVERTEELLRRLLPEALHPRITELTTELTHDLV